MTIDKVGLLLINLGTPDDLSLAAVKRYLKEFLSDPKVLDINPALRFILVNALILPFRSPKTLEAYQAVWQKDGSPLMIHSRKLEEKLSRQLDMPVALGMRYQSPSIEQAIEQLIDNGVDSIRVLPLFPQYADAVTGSILEKIRVLKKRYNVKFELIQDFYNNDAFIQALANRFRQEMADIEYDHVLVSYHGLPVRQVVKIEGENFPCDQEKPCPKIGEKNRLCYRAQCYETTSALANALEWHSNEYSVAFQSRLGRIPWIKPYTDEAIQELYNAGVRRLVVICPSFLSDCLETIEEIGIRLKEDWFKLGGTRFHLIPCLNDDPQWVEGIKLLIR